MTFSTTDDEELSYTEELGTDVVMYVGIEQYYFSFEEPTYSTYTLTLTLSDCGL